MRRTLFMASALTICVSGAFAAQPTLPVTHMRGVVHRVISSLPRVQTLHDQNSDDSGVAAVSTNFTHDFDSYDSYGADDFTVPAGHKWRIKQVEVSGVYGQNSRPAQSENISIYKDQNGLPGQIVAQCRELVGTDNSGSFAIRIPKNCKILLTGGSTYWLSVVANENNVCCTTWGWETRSSQSEQPAAWENPGDGFHTGCADWDVMAACLAKYDVGPDFMFTLKGKDITN